MKIAFRSIEIGKEFELNGTRYRKQSTRTAKMLAYQESVFYVDSLAPCRVFG